MGIFNILLAVVLFAAFVVLVVLPFLVCLHGLYSWITSGLKFNYEHYLDWFYDKTHRSS